MPKDVIDAVGAVDISTAAERLGISVQTLEGVLERGLLKGFRDADGRWKVLLEGGPQEGAGAAPHVSIARETGGGPAPTLSRILDDTRSPLERVLAEQVDFLRVQLADRDRAIIDKDAVIADLSRALRALPASKLSQGASCDEEIAALSSGSHVAGIAAAIRDGRLIPEAPEAVLAAGRQNRVPVVVGALCAPDSREPLGSLGDGDGDGEEVVTEDSTVSLRSPLRRSLRSSLRGSLRYRARLAAAVRSRCLRLRSAAISISRSIRP